METIAHRELRNNSSEILARVKQGESFRVTNRGEVTAILSPPEAASVLDRLAQAGHLRPARRQGTDFSALRRADGESTAAILADLRGDR